MKCLLKEVASTKSFSQLLLPQKIKSLMTFVFGLRFIFKTFVLVEVKCWPVELKQYCWSLLWCCQVFKFDQITSFPSLFYYPILTVGNVGRLCSLFLFVQTQLEFSCDKNSRHNHFCRGTSPRYMAFKPWNIFIEKLGYR